METITTFNNLLSTHPQTVSLSDVFTQIKTDEHLKIQTEMHRQGAGQKQRVPVFVPSAIMEGGRKTENIKQLTGLLYFDYDHLDEKQMTFMVAYLGMLMHCVGYHRSLSGKGLHVIVAYQVFYHDMQPMDLTELDFQDPKKSQRSRLLWNAIWEDVRRQFEEWFSNTPTLKELRVDTQCKDAARPSAMAYDPDAKYFKDNFQPYTVILSQALLDFEQSKAHVATGNPVGRPVKTQLSRAFDAAEAFAKTQGFEPKHGTLNKFLSTVIYEVNRYGIEQEDALAEAKDRYFYYGDGERGITSVVKSIYESKQAEFGTLRLPNQQKTSEKKVHRATSADIEAFLLSQGTYRKNQISHRLEVQWNEGSQMAQYHQRNLSSLALVAPSSDNTLSGWESTPNSSPLTPHFQELHDSDVATLMRLFFEETSLTTTSTDVYNVLQSDTCSLPYNPFFAYLQPLQGQWKPGDKDYLHELIQTVEVEGGEETRALLDDFFTRWMVAMVHGWIHMSSTHGTILTFIGAQGVGKSSWMRMLMPPELRAYYKEQMRFRNLDKDDRIQLAECGLINLEEIDAMSEAEVNQLKSLVTLDVIRERLPYDKSPRTMPRIATFCATGNRADFLTDPTGNRRWLTFTVRRFTVNPFEYRPDYEHIYAQALYLAQHEAGMFVMSQQDIRQLDKHNEQYVSQSVEVELCNVYVHHPNLGEDGQPLSDSKWMTAAEIAGRLNYYNPSARLSIRGIALALKQQGIDIRISRGVKQYLVRIE